MFVRPPRVGGEVREGEGEEEREYPRLPAGRGEQGPQDGAGRYVDLQPDSQPTTRTKEKCTKTVTWNKFNEILF